MADTPIVALEIGTSKVCALVGETRDDGHITITGLGQCPSVGVRKGAILDMGKVVECIRVAISQAEDSGQVAISEVSLVVSGGHIHSSVNPGNVPVLNSESGVTEDDMDAAMAMAKAVNRHKEWTIIHSIPQRYRIDDEYVVTNPLGMSGAKLSLDMLIAYGSSNLIGNAMKAVHEVGLEVVEHAFSGLCAALATLTPEQKQSEVLLVDCGAGITSYVAYAGGVIADMGTLAIGGDHVTNDIMMGFNLPFQRAEALKRETGSAIMDSSSHIQQISIPEEVGFKARSISACDLNVVINARVEELFEEIKKALIHKNISCRLGAGIVLTGGGARLRGIDAVAAHVFDLPCCLGKTNTFTGLSTASQGIEYAALLGMLRLALKKKSDSRQKEGLIERLTRMLGG